jgi:uncharacterized phage-associated protein
LNRQALTMIITHEREKLIDAIIYFVQNTKHCGLVKLFKLLYLLDFIHFRQAGRSVTGLNYCVWPRGPAPRELWHEIKGGPEEDLAQSVGFENPDETELKRLTRIVARRQFDGRYFSKREKVILDKLAFIYLDAKADDMIEVTHLKGHPWETTLKEKGLNAEIDYMRALDGGTDQLDYEEIEDRIAENKAIKEAFK